LTRRAVSSVARLLFPEVPWWFIVRDIKEGFDNRLVFLRSLICSTTPFLQDELSAPIIMDLPAPVSPERIVKPGKKETWRSSMIAKFFYREIVSIVYRSPQRSFVLRTSK
jgi:hypothetical protein